MIKKYFLLTILLLAVNTFAQCPSSNLIFNSQAQIDAFAIDYPGCSLVSGSVTISGSDITDLSGLTGISSIGGQLIIQNNNILTTLSGWDEVALLGTSAKISITSNPLLEDLTTFFGVLNEGLELINLPVLSDISGFNGISSMSNLEISNCDSLLNLNGLENVSNLASDPIVIIIDGNEGLKDLSALNQVDTESVTSLGINANPSLANCSELLICGVVQLGTATISFSANAVGCESVEAVLESCALSINDNQLSTDISIYPNPAKDRLTIQISEPLQLFNVSVFTLIGQKVLEQTTSSINISGLSAGVYFVRVATNRGSIFKRLIKN